jgi:AhpD family alkylhydroperoxidase
MAWVRQVDPEKAQGKAKEVLDAIKKQLGFVPETYRMMAMKPEFLQKVLELDEVTFSRGALDPKTKHLIAMGVSASAGCQYCVAAHATLAQNHGATHEEIAEALQAAATISLYNTYNKATGIEIDIRPKT